MVKWSPVFNGRSDDNQDNGINYTDGNGDPLSSGNRMYEQESAHMGQTSYAEPQREPTNTVFPSDFGGYLLHPENTLNQSSDLVHDSDDMIARKDRSVNDTLPPPGYAAKPELTHNKDISFFGDSNTTEPYAESRSTLDQTGLHRGSITTLPSANSHRRGSAQSSERRDSWGTPPASALGGVHSPESATSTTVHSNAPLGRSVLPGDSTVSSLPSNKWKATTTDEVNKQSDDSAPRQNSLSGMASAAVAGVAVAATGAAAAATSAAGAILGTNNQEHSNSKMPSAWPDTTTAASQKNVSGTQQDNYILPNDATEKKDATNCTHEPSIHGQNPCFYTRSNVCDEKIQDANSHYCDQVKEPSIHGQHPSFYCDRQEHGSGARNDIKSSAITGNDLTTQSDSIDAPEATTSSHFSDSRQESKGMGSNAITAAGSSETDSRRVADETSSKGNAAKGAVAAAGGGIAAALGGILGLHHEKDSQPHDPLDSQTGSSTARKNRTDDDNTYSQQVRQAYTGPGQSSLHQDKLPLGQDIDQQPADNILMNNNIHPQQMHSVGNQVPMDHANDSLHPQTGSNMGPAPIIAGSTRAPDVSSSTKAPDVSSSTKAPDVSSSTKAPDVSSNAKAPDVSSNAKAPNVSSSRQQAPIDHADDPLHPQTGNVGAAPDGDVSTTGLADDPHHAQSLSKRQSYTGIPPIIAGSSGTPIPGNTGYSHGSFSSSRAIKDNIVPAPADGSATASRPDEVKERALGRQNQIQNTEPEPKRKSSLTDGIKSAFRRISLGSDNNQSPKSEGRRMSAAEAYKNQTLTHTDKSNSNHQEHPGGFIVNNNNVDENTASTTEKYARVPGIYSMKPSGTANVDDNEEANFVKLNDEAHANAPTKSTLFFGKNEHRRGSIQNTFGKIIGNKNMQDRGTLSQVSGNEKIHAYNAYNNSS